jgi:hypothetical protein
MDNEIHITFLSSHYHFRFEIPARNKLGPGIVKQRPGQSVLSDD